MGRSAAGQTARPGRFRVVSEAQANMRSQLEAQWAVYAATLAGKLDDLELAARSLREDAPPDQARQALEAVRALSHRLAGSGATFGFVALGRVARDLEALCDAIVEDGVPPSPEQRGDIGGLLKDLRRAAEVSPDPPPAALGLAVAPAAGERERTVILVEDDEPAARQLERDLTSFGFQVRVLDHPAQLREAVTETLPAAVILDGVFAGGDWVGADVVTSLRGDGALDRPVVFLSERDDLRARLASVRAGCDGYLVKPANIADIVDLLDRLTLGAADEAFRVLVVDDDAEVARHTEPILGEAGMITASVDDPMKIVGPLEGFRPELILMDLHMPGCSGQELAAVIRQQASYTAIPIVFLSSETNVRRQLQALERGGDDFLSKSLSPGELILAVTTRARRFRLLRSMMTRDGLTGLLNHTNTKQRLEIEIDRARRANAPLAFVMVDIDRFKVVNDTYGHAAGDAVIKSLARLMKERLRATDIVGRMGGEEFAAVLADTDALVAARIFDELRRAFSRIRHNAEGREFLVTMSCGVAQFPNYDDASRLSNAADKALYAAKHKGRDRVETAWATQAPSGET